MRTVIKGRVYDTSKAKLVGEIESQYPTADLRYYKEQLYRKQVGEYFLYGFGLAESKYGKKTRSGKTSGKKFIPLDYESAKSWAEKHLEKNPYNEFFGEIDKSNKETALLVVHAPKWVGEQLKKLAEMQHKTQGEVLASLLDDKKQEEANHDTSTQAENI